MKKGLFREVRTSPRHPKWREAVKRQDKIYGRDDDIRSEFARDYNRILHCTAYRRLKHKTQVFFATTNDHICTRMEHVSHVISVSHTIAKYLGLNTELTHAIAIGHDLGHAPFGHAGEDFLKNLTKKELDHTFWHEKNSLRFVDKCETLEGPNGYHKNLNLTYAVRDGIVCHCGEVDENAIIPRDDFVDLNEIQKPNQFSPFTWEGCVVKIADKIAYLGRDIEDAITLRILSFSQLKDLKKMLSPNSKAKLREVNNTVLMHNFIIDLCENSSPKEGIKISEESLKTMISVKDFNNKNIYFHPRLNNYGNYAELIIKIIFQTLKDFYRKEKTLDEVRRYSNTYPTLVEVFSEWLLKYAYPEQRGRMFKNEILYDLKKKKDYLQSIIDFISGMTDIFAIKVFTEVTTFF